MNSWPTNLSKDQEANSNFKILNDTMPTYKTPFPLKLSMKNVEYCLQALFCVRILLVENGFVLSCWFININCAA